MEEELSGTRSSSGPTKRPVAPEVMLPNSLCRSPPELDDGKASWDAGWERVVAAAVAEAQRDESGRKIKTTWRTLEGMLGSEERHGMGEKICHTSATHSRF